MINYKRKYNLLLSELINVYFNYRNQDYFIKGSCNWFWIIQTKKHDLRKDNINWSEDYYYQQISILEDLIFNKTKMDIIIDKCIIKINKYK